MVKTSGVSEATCTGPEKHTQKPVSAGSRGSLPRRGGGRSNILANSPKELLKGGFNQALQPTS